MEHVGSFAGLFPGEIVEAIGSIEINFQNVEKLSLVLSDLEATTENLEEVLVAIAIVQGHQLPGGIGEMVVQVKTKN